MDWYEKIVDLFVNVTGVGIGAYLAYKAALKVAQWQHQQASKDKTESYLRYLHSEFTQNRVILRRLKSYINGPQSLENFWAPAKAISSHIVSEAWDTLVQNGVLPYLNEEQQTVLAITNRSVRDAHRTIDETEANWHRIREWEEYDRKREALQPTSVNLFMHSVVPGVVQSIEYAIEQLDEAIGLLEGNEKKC